MRASMIQVLVYFGVLFFLVKPVGAYIACIYQRKPTWLSNRFECIENRIYRFAGIRADEDMNWKDYAKALLLFNVLGIVFLYLLQRWQAYLPLNPQNLPQVPNDVALNSAISFTSNTDWQSYSSETSLSDLTQMLGLGGQNFLSAANGIAVLMALTRGFIRKRAQGIGNYWVDITRCTLYILLPFSTILAILLVTQGVVQTCSPYKTVHHIFIESPVNDTVQQSLAKQTLAVGPVASQVAIKQLGTNGGGFFSANAAHPFENPTPVSNFLEMLAILLLPASLCYSFGIMIDDTRQSGVLLASMTTLLLVALITVIMAEQDGNPYFNGLGIDQLASVQQGGGNMEGKETRFGIVNSALWTVLTTATANGSVNAMHDSYMPLSGLVAMVLMQLGEVIFGGVGSGLCGMLIFAMITVFIAGLMIGRTPEYLGKKIDSFEMKMSVIVMLIPSLLILGGSALCVLLPSGKSAVFNHGAHGFSEILYAISSVSSNNGSAFSGLQANGLFYNLLLGIIMLLSRYSVIVALLAISGSLAAKNSTPVNIGTLATHTPLFGLLLSMVILLLGALTFIPALALGPIVEHLQILQIRQ